MAEYDEAYRIEEHKQQAIAGQKREKDPDYEMDPVRVTIPKPTDHERRQGKWALEFLTSLDDLVNLRTSPRMLAHRDTSYLCITLKLLADECLLLEDVEAELRTLHYRYQGYDFDNSLL